MLVKFNKRLTQILYFNKMQIRAKVVVVLQDKAKFLFTACYEQLNNQVFYIPVGGGIEAGEYSIDAAKREVLEEIDQEIENLELLNISENIFIYNAIEEHEIVFAYSADFKNKLAYDTMLVGNLNANGIRIKIAWATIEEMRNKHIKIYPESLWEILEQLTRVAQSAGAI
jgi:ADP-ribose pyrophosphatase YjhB (NUDIX family)